MGDILPMFMRQKRKRKPADDVSAAFTECCTALNKLTPKAREMVSGWLHQRYLSQLEEDMHIADDATQPARDEEYVRRISRRET